MGLRTFMDRASHSNGWGPLLLILAVSCSDLDQATCYANQPFVFLLVFCRKFLGHHVKLSTADYLYSFLM